MKTAYRFYDSENDIYKMIIADNIYSAINANEKNNFPYFVKNVEVLSDRVVVATGLYDNKKISFRFIWMKEQDELLALVVANTMEDAVKAFEHEFWQGGYDIKYIINIEAFECPTWVV